MKKITNLLLLALLVFSYQANAYPNNNRPKTVTQEERMIGSFRGIASGGSLTIKVTMGIKESVRFEGDKDAIAELITEVDGGTLGIKPKTKWSEWSRRYNRPEITVYITAKKLNTLTLSGSGSITVTNAITGPDLTTTLSGSGSITTNASVGTFTGVISGSGTVTVSGKADNSTLTLSGSGNFRGKNLSTNKVSVQISGSADVYIRASQKIDAVVSGSGNIYYSGEASVTKTIIGSGNISKI